MMIRSNRFQCSKLLLPENDQPELTANSSSSSSSSDEFDVVSRSSLKRTVSTEQTDLLSRSTKRRRVQIDESRTSVHGEGRTMSFEDQKSSFYTRQDLNNMKQSAKQFCSQIDLDDPLFRAYQHDDTPLNDEVAHQKASLLSSSQGFEEQRGLERWTSQTHLLSRCVNIVRVRTEVLLEQISQSISLQKDPERLAKVYRTASAPSASYARVLGLADVALRDNNNNNSSQQSSSSSSA